jgi:transcriptional regulator with GAF, ATPase, and Fis domain
LHDLSPVTRQRRWIWALGAILLLSLTATVVLLSWIMGKGEGGWLVTPESRWPMLLGLVGLVLIFVIYIFVKQRQLDAIEARVRQLMVREAALRAHISELSAIFDAATQLAEKLDLRGTLELAARRILPCLEADLSSIMLLNPQTGCLEVKAVAGAEARQVEGRATKPGEGIAGLVYSTGESLVLNPDQLRSGFAQEFHLGRKPVSGLCVPLRFQGNTLGVFNVCRLEGSEAFTAVHARMLETFAEHCAAAVVKTFHFRRQSQSPPQAA